MRSAKWKNIFLTLFFVAALAQKSLAQAPLETGQWVKFSVEANGVYKIDYNLLRSAGFDPDNIDPRNIGIFGNGSGMLPQPNDAPRTNHLEQLSIWVIGENDGVFNQGDYILFYAEGPDHVCYDVDRKIFHYENHLYSDKNYYYLTTLSMSGNRLINSENINGTFPLIKTFDDFVFHETEKYNELKSGRVWFGEQFDVTTSLSLNFNMEGIASPSDVKIVSSVMAQSFSPSSFSLSLNGVTALNQEIPSIMNSQYDVKGQTRIDTVLVNLTQNGNSQSFQYRFNKGTSGKSVGYLDFLLASFERALALYGAQTSFSSVRSLDQPTSTFEITGITTSSLVWDVTDPLMVQLQEFSINGSNGQFSTSTEELKTFIVFNPSEVVTPKFEAKIDNQNLSDQSSPELLIVSHPSFRSEADRLADHRRAHNNISVLVVTPEEVYNEYSGGKQDPTAIRDFAKELYQKGRLKNILLFGRASYDYKNRVNKNTNFVPTYESRNSLSPLETYSSDDFFGFFEPSEGEWKESSGGNDDLEVGVGRLPVKQPEEGTNIVDKLISYDLNPKARGEWRKQILFVADDGDSNLHQRDADKLTRDIEATQFGIDTKKLYIDAFKQISRPSGQVSPDAREALIRNLKQGTVIVNFTGHGSEKVWLDERILDDQLIIDDWENEIVFPMMVTATCEFGRHEDPAQISSSELALLKKNGGAIGFVTAARPVNAATNAFLNNAFYDALFLKENDKYRDLGSIFRDTKNNSVNGISNRNFSLLGDPSMTLAIPNDEVVATEVRTINGSDTLKALSRVKVVGEIRANGIKNDNFNGTVLITLRDKEFSFETLGDENPKFTYKERSNTLFRGEATVADGDFESEFILPKNIAYQVGTGKLSFYAKGENSTSDAIGGSIGFKIGESETSVEADNTAPVVKLYIGDSTFINGGIASSNTILFARLNDSSGINVANYGVGNNLVAILDDTQSFEVSEYYVADLDDFKKGSIRFPLENLSPGKHVVELRVWDVYNNNTSAKVNFVVNDGQGVQIEELGNFPNPFSGSTTFQFTHNRSGEDLEVMATIIDMTGRPVNSIEYSVPNSAYSVTLPEWDGTNAQGTKLDTGIYLLRLEVRSTLDGSKNERISKLIRLN